MNKAFHISNVNRGDKVMIRVDFNMPIRDGVVYDDFRLRSHLDFIKRLSQVGAKVILISHLGDGRESLRPVYECLRSYIKTALFLQYFDANIIKNKINNLNPGQILLLNNIRRFEGETTNADAFSKFLTSLCDYYVFDAFAVSHRQHASVVGVQNFKQIYFGPLMISELSSLNKFKPNEKTLLILGGAKISTKLKIINRYIKNNSHIILAGGMANNILKARGYNIGKSYCDDSIKLTEQIFNNDNIIVPAYYLDQYHNVIAYNNLNNNSKIIDVAKQSVMDIIKVASNFDKIIINGPLGIYENGGAEGTKLLLKGLAKADKEILIGGGDTVSMVEKLKLNKAFTHVSTGGGAMLYYLGEGNLPVIK